MSEKGLENEKNLETLGIKETCFECETFLNIRSAQKKWYMTSIESRLFMRVEYSLFF